jgi:hypothetical protein
MQAKKQLAIKPRFVVRNAQTGCMLLLATSIVVAQLLSICFQGVGYLQRSCAFVLSSLHPTRHWHAKRRMSTRRADAYAAACVGVAAPAQLLAPA